MRIGQHVVIFSRDALRATAGTIIRVNDGPIATYGVALTMPPDRYGNGRDRIVEVPAGRVIPLAGR